MELSGTKQQECLSHGRGLVVRRAVFGKDAAAFDASILLPESSSNDESEDDKAEDDVEPLSHSVRLGGVLKRLRSVARGFRKKSIMMDATGHTTRRSDNNCGQLRPILDCQQWRMQTFFLRSQNLGLYSSLPQLDFRGQVSLKS